MVGEQIFLAKIEWFYSSDDIPSMAIGDDWKPYHQSVLLPPASVILSFIIYRLSFPDHSYMCRILAGVGKNELIVTDMVDYIDTQSLNGVACFPFFLD